MRLSEQKFEEETCYSSPAKIKSASQGQNFDGLGKSNVKVKSIFFFCLLVTISVCNTAVFKLSQKGGEYQYNTLSAMTVVEGLKLCISFCQCAHSNRGNREACILSFRKLSTHLIRNYVVLALSYAGYNQLIFPG